MTLRQEVWYPHPSEKDLWIGEHGLLVNTAALEERTAYFEVVRLLVPPLPLSDYETFGERLV